MQRPDLWVVHRALKWSVDDKRVWLCTVSTTYGSAPRVPGSLLAANANGHQIGSLSGGCIGDDFLERITASGFPDPAATVCYDEGDGPNSNVRPPYGGILDVLMENLAPDCNVQAHLRELESALLDQRRPLREIELGSGARSLHGDSSHSPRVECDSERVRLRVGAAQRLLLADYSSVARTRAGFDKGLGFEMILCNPHEEALRGVLLEGIEIRRELPSLFIVNGGCHADTAVMALTHDPKIGDLAMLEAVRTGTFYIGAIGSWVTSEKRFERLWRISGLGDAGLVRVHAPIDLNLGSRIPAEITLAMLANTLRIRNSIPRKRL